MILTSVLRTCFAAIKHDNSKYVNRISHNLTLHIYNIRLFSDDSDDEHEKKNKKREAKAKKAEEAKKKLNLLLNSILEEKESPRSKLSKEFSRPKRKEKSKMTTEATTKSIEEQTIEAAKSIATSQGKVNKQVEFELLSKLLFRSSTDKTVQSTDQTSPNLSELISEMKVEQEPKSTSAQMSRAHQVRQILDKSDDRRESRKPRPKIDKRSHGPSTESPRAGLFSHTDTLGIFGSDLTKGLELETWHRLALHQMKLAVTHPPSNYFQEMELLTEQRKLWKFPIDNEQGMDNEKDVYFADHIFLDRHLDPWCPKRGPVRHFMELVCVGLSKNHYLSVDEKKAHIDWFREYFESKKDLLREVGAFPEEIQQSSAEAK